MSALLLVLATTVKVLIPSFEVVGAPGVLAVRLPKDLAADMETAKCANPTPIAKVGPQTALALLECDQHNECLAHVAKVSGADLVLIGRVQKLDEVTTVRMRLIEASDGTVRKNLELRHEGSLKTLPQTIAGFAATLCKAVNPDWASAEKPAVDLSSLDFDNGLDAPTLPTPPPPAPVLAAVIPAPKLEPSVSPEPPVIASTPAPAPPVIAPTPAPVAAPRPAIAENSPRTTVQPKLVERPPTWTLAGPRSPKVRTWALVGLGATGVALATGAGLGGATMSALSSRSSATSQRDFYSAQSTMQTRAVLSNVAFGVGAVALISSVVLWLRGDSLFTENPRQVP